MKVRTFICTKSLSVIISLWNYSLFVNSLHFSLSSRVRWYNFSLGRYSLHSWLRWSVYSLRLTWWFFSSKNVVISFLFLDRTNDQHNEILIQILSSPINRRSVVCCFSVWRAGMILLCLDLKSIMIWLWQKNCQAIWCLSCNEKNSSSLKLYSIVSSIRNLNKIFFDKSKSFTTAR